MYIYLFILYKKLGGSEMTQDFKRERERESESLCNVADQPLGLTSCKLCYAHLTYVLKAGGGGGIGGRGGNIGRGRGGGG